MTASRHHRLAPLAAGLALVALAACGTPLQRCTADATADLRALQAERAERQRNLQRGYALERRPVPAFRPLLCPDPLTGAPAACLHPWPDWHEVAVPVNRRIEARRIELLDRLIAEEQARAAAAEAACLARFPPG